MTLHEILRVKGSTVHAIGPDATLEDVVQRLVQLRCGSLVVCEGGTPAGALLGIISERDILRACAAHHASLTELRVGDTMSTDVITGRPEDSVEETMGVMTNHRVRHLPILSHGQLAGMISIGDVVKAQFDSLSLENHYLKTYIHS